MRRGKRHEKVREGDLGSDLLKGFPHESRMREGDGHAGTL